jgi:ATP-dependent RNA helicase DeaD
MKSVLFEALGLDSRLLRGVEVLGFTEPTPIQREAIPELIAENRDLIGLAQTGTGKTAAFGLPLLHKIDTRRSEPQALVLAPTRELCLQISKDLNNFGQFLPGLSIVAVYGGASIQDQMRTIRKGVQIVVATPGRLIDLIKRKALSLSKVDFLILDEADEMLNMGFKEDIDYILSNTPEERVTWLFSATMPSEVRHIAKEYMQNPIELSVAKREEGAAKIEHVYHIVKARDRYLALKRVVDAHPDLFAIVFCRTKIETQEVAEHLIRDGYNADSLHGDLSQAQRDKVMARYRERALQLLVATDVAARGIDVQDVTHVIHYNLPDELENYMHRSGRTARAGKSGVSVSIISIKEQSKIAQIERQMKKKFIKLPVPTGMEVCEKQLLNLVKRVHEVSINEAEIAPYLPAIYDELREIDREELIRRFVSMEFNRFLEYYQNAPDLNSEMNTKGRDGFVNDGYRAGGPRMFISIGAKDGLDKGRLLRFMCDESGERSNIFGRIDVKGVFSFVDVQADKLQEVLQKLNGTDYNGRRVRTEITEDGGGGEGGGGGRSRGPRSSSDRPSREGRGGGGYGGGGRSSGGSRGGSGGGDRRYSSRSGGSSSGSSDRKPSGGESKGGSRKEKFTKW